MTVIISVWHKRPIYSPVVYTVYSPDTLTSTIEQEMSVYIVTDFFLPSLDIQITVYKIYELQHLCAAMRNRRVPNGSFVCCCYMKCSYSKDFTIAEPPHRDLAKYIQTWLRLSAPSLSFHYMTLYLQINTAKCGKPVIYHTDKYCAYVSIHIQIYFCKQTRGKNPQRNTSL